MWRDRARSALPRDGRRRDGDRGADLAAGPIVPLGFDLANGESPSAVQWLGVAVVLGGIALLAREPGKPLRGGLAAGVPLALVAALGFGLFFVGLDAAADGGVPWTIVTARATSTTIAVLLAVSVSVAVAPPSGLVPTVVAVGLFDTAANVLVAFATTRGSVGIVAVLSALYPVVTLVLARLALGERLDGWSRVGGVLALGGAAAVAAG